MLGFVNEFGNPRGPVVNDRSGSKTGAGGPKGSMARAVGTFVPKLTKKAVEKYGFSAAALITDWSTIVGADLAAYTEPKRLKWPREVEAYAETGATGRPGATLELRVDAARALEVQYKARQIMERINAYFGYRAIAELRVIQAPFETAGTNATRKPRQAVAKKPRPAGPAPDMSHVGDDDLRAALEKLHRNLSSR
jgi:hypothetical protein